MTKTITSWCAPLPIANVDTDIIMPKRFLKTITREGLAEGAFADLRFDDEGDPRPEFVLNKEPWRKASILVVGDNFGCGSSREHAVWGLVQLGIQACIGTGFAGIFYDNARKNGLALPIVDSDCRDHLLRFADKGQRSDLSIDIAERTLHADGKTYEFKMDDATRQSLHDGRDDTLDTLKLINEIQTYESNLDAVCRIRVLK